MKTKTNLSSQLKLKFEQSLAIDDKLSTMSSGSMDNLHVKLVSRGCPECTSQKTPPA